MKKLILTMMVLAFISCKKKENELKKQVEITFYSNITSSMDWVIEVNGTSTTIKELWAEPSCQTGGSKIKVPEGKNCFQVKNNAGDLINSFTFDVQDVCYVTLVNQNTDKLTQ